MTSPRIAFQDGYKYQLAEDYVVETGLAQPAFITTRFIELSPSGRLTIKGGYAWDGPSGPTVDTLNFMRGSLVHDALYQLMREGHLDHKKHRDDADRLLRRLCREDGMGALRAWWVYAAVRKAAGPAAAPRNLKPTRYAPVQWRPLA